MANKWRTTVSEANAVFVGYGVHPSDLESEALTRKWTGIDRSVLYSLITTLRTTTTVTDPKADGQTYAGTWTVDSVDPVLDEGGNTAGSATIVQVLKKNIYSSANPDNLTTVRSRAYPLEQNENAWMYYERFKSEVTSRWHNISAANIVTEYDKVRKIVSSSSFATDFYFAETDLYQIMYINHTGVKQGIIYGHGTSCLWAPATLTYHIPILAESDDVWYVQAAGGATTTLENPVIRECWYEKNNDGTYNLFRTLETTSTTAIMRVRALQYAGMTLLQGSPMLDDGALTIAGFNNLTEVVYKDARFRIGGDTYRVLANSTAVAGQVTVDVSPAVTQATEDAADANSNATQVFWDAL